MLLDLNFHELMVWIAWMKQVGRSTLSSLSEQKKTSGCVD